MAFQQDEGGGGGGFGQKSFQGNWKCSKCSKEITSLPFDPDPNRLDQLKCYDCHRESRSFRRDFR
ncbi:MAG: hypothetical protein KJI72_03155 [Patescibacteria group bacterium]|nr:hypothetical protein [Patescibacteria group bacterium]